LAPPSIAAAGATITAESFRPANHRADPGERLGVDFGLRNTGPTNTNNLTATLLVGGGVTAPGTPQAYGALAAGGASISRSFSFTVDPSLPCGTPVVATLQLWDGSRDLGAVSFTLGTGHPGVPADPCLAPGVTVTPTDGLVLAKSGADTTFSVVLNTRPNSAVTIGFSSSDPSAVAVAPSALSFVPENWSQPQTVRVTGIGAPWHDTTYTIRTAPAASADPNYAGLDPPDAHVTERGAADVLFLPVTAR
jgi:hypothetical protein